MLYLTARMVVAPAMRAVFRPTVEGTRHVPRTGAVILASNHLSFIDSVVIPMVAPRQVHFLAKADYFTGTGLKGAGLRMWMNSMGMIPVDRDDPKAATNSLEIALDVLGRGGAFGIYPEGTRSRDGRIFRGRTGVAHLALETGAPVVPVGLQGTPDIQPIGTNRPRVAHATIRFGEPLRFAERYADVPAGKARRQVTDEIMTAIAALSGQDEAGVYNEHPPAT